MPISRLDVVYRKLLLTKFFTKGWGIPEHLERLFNFRKVMSNRNSCYNLIPKEYPITIINSKKDVDCYIIEGKFESPFALHLPGLVRPEVRDAFFQMVLPLNWNSEYKPVCIHLAGTGDHYFWRRRNMMAKPLLNVGIGSIIVENPFYGLRKPIDQQRSSVHYVSDIFVMGGCLILECIVLLNWCEQLGFGPLGVTGISMGGHGVMSESIDWDFLQDQYFSNKLYCDKLSKVCKIVDDPFACNLSKSFSDYELQYEMDLVDELKSSYITPHELVNSLKNNVENSCQDVSYRSNHKSQLLSRFKKMPPFIPSKKRWISITNNYFLRKI
ncbi:hypothetical protein ABEB36_011262 [Hypothenemus hampei]|uniref:Protein ABHD18 n=2 Tax=Hypothenemus hampei TaxID=57062 RepID=A0ABD1EES1_HYPHA